MLALAGADNPSLILFRHGNWSDTDVIQRMDEMLQRLAAADITQSIIVVDRDRLRRRKLPIE